MELLDTDLIRRGRQERRMSKRQLARSISVATSTVTRLEDGSNHAELSLGLVDLLAKALAGEPWTLYHGRDAKPVREPNPTRRRRRALRARCAHRLRRTVGLVRDEQAATEEQIEAAGRRRYARNGITLTEARVLAAIIDGADARSLHGTAKENALAQVRKRRLRHQ